MANVGTVLSFIATAAAVVGANYLITDGVVKGGLADIRVETATLTTKVDERVGSIREDQERSVAEMQGLVDGAMVARTDELLRALLASQDTDTDWLIRIANVPRDSAAAEKMEAIVQGFSGRSTKYALGGKLNYELKVESLTDEQAMLVQEAWDAAADPTIAVKIFPSADALRTIKGPPDR